jgi:rhamnose transport system substrate-binding protein
MNWVSISQQWRPADAGATSQIPFLKTQIQRGVDVIAISPNSPDALNQVFKQAMDEGIKVLIVNSDIPGSEDFRDVAILPMDFEVTGSSQVELMGSLIDYEGDIAVVSATADAPDQNYWIEGMKEALKNPKYAKMNLVDVVYGDDDPQKSTTEAEALLTKYPNSEESFLPPPSVSPHPLRLLRVPAELPSSRSRDWGTPNQMRRFIKNGTVEAFALWSPFDEGYLAAYLGVALATGEVEAAEGVDFEVPVLVHAPSAPTELSSPVLRQCSLRRISTILISSHYS